MSHADQLLPLVDLDPLTSGTPEEQAALFATVDRCLREAGFLVVVGHGVDPAVRRQARLQGRAFFARAGSAKALYAGDGMHGWVAPGQESHYLDAEAQAPDLKEVFKIARDDTGWFPAVTRNVWPHDMAGFQEAMQAYVEAMVELAPRLLVLIAGALGLDPTFFTSRCGDRHGQCNLNWYPSLNEIGPGATNQFRIGPHTDFGGMTILDREPGVAGLQIQAVDGSWVDAPFHPDSLVINIGDLLSAWTGGRWRSTPHRVLPPDPAAPDETLLSIAFFQGFDEDAIVESLPAPIGGPVPCAPIRVGDYIQGRIAAFSIA
jgi:isopenicillin N synthase-like dioxygenase